jgi:hypothetical protein
MRAAFQFAAICVLAALHSAPPNSTQEGYIVLIAIAFLCLSNAVDCPAEAVARAVVGQGVTPNGCLMDGLAGAAANAALAHGDDYRLVIVCRRKALGSALAAKAAGAK